MIFPFKISEYHWEAELMFNIKRINARVIQLAPDLCSYTSSDLEVSCNEVRLQAEASPDIFLVCGRSHVTVRSSGAALTSHCSSTCSTAALHRCSRPQDSEDLSRFPLSSIFSKPQNSIHWFCTLFNSYTMTTHIIHCIYIARLSSSIHFAWLPWSGPTIQLSSYTKTLPGNSLVARRVILF